VISVVIPTISGREHWLERCMTAYRATGPAEMELIVIKDRATCGLAWQAGADLSAGGYVHFTADDIVPHPGWWEAAVACCDSGAIPSARILNTDGSLQSSGAWATDLPEGMVTDIARIPFLSREQWQLVGPMIEVHYYTDNYVAVRAAQAGIPTIVCQAYEFTHHYAPEGRLDARMAADREVFERAVAA
jgi:hypothetical protein